MNGERQARQPGGEYVWLKALLKRVFRICLGEEAGEEKVWQVGRQRRLKLGGCAVPFLKVTQACAPAGPRSPVQCAAP